MSVCRLRLCLCSCSRRASRSRSTSTSTPAHPHPHPHQATHSFARPRPARPASTADLLHDTRELVQRYPLLEHTSWATTLEHALVDLQHHRTARVAVAGERDAGTTALVTAAFDDPLSSDDDLAVALASRRLGDAPEAIAFTYADKTRAASHELAIPSAWLRDNHADVVEVVFSDVSPLQSSLDILHLSDATVLLVSELVLLSPASLRSLVLELSSKPNLFLALNVSDPAHPSALASLEHSLATLLPSTSIPPVVLVSTALATTGLKALSDPSPSFAVFQTSYNSSGVPDLKDILANAIASISHDAPEGSTAPSALQLQTAEYVLEKAIHAITFEGARINDALEQATADVAALSFVGSEAARRVLLELGVESGRLQIPRDQRTAAKAALDDLFESRLAWWKLPVRTDDLVSDMAVVVDRSYLRPFEDRLIFNTGRLVALSASMTRRVDDLLASPAFAPPPTASPLSSLYSPLLLNKIHQAALESNKIASGDLSAPLLARRQQITAPGGPAEVLQAKAQQHVVAAASVSGGSVFGAIASQLAEVAEMGTNLGLGLFGTVLAAWILQRRWAKARQQFFVDVEQRVTGGLEDELGAAAQRLVDRSLFMTRTTVAGSEELLRQRRASFDAFAASLAQTERKRRRV